MEKSPAYRPTREERRRYVLKKKSDLEILARCKELEKARLPKGDTILVRLIKSQLKDDWRKPLLKELNRLIRKYRK